MAQNQTSGSSGDFTNTTSEGSTLDDDAAKSSQPASYRTYPFVTGTNYTNYENQDTTVANTNDPDVDNDTEDDVPDEVKAARAEVENTRAELTGTIDALKEKLSPANLVAEAKEATVGAAQTAAHDALDTAKTTASNVVGAAKDAAVSAVDSVKEVATNVAASAKSVIGDAVSAVSGAAHSAGHTAKNAVHSVKETSSNVGGSAKGAGATIVETIRLNPIPAAITGIGLGWLIMSMRRQSETGMTYRSEGVYNPDRFVSTTDEYGQSNFGTSYSGQTGSSTSPIDAAKEKLGDVKDSVTSRASDLASNVSEKASGLASTVSDKASDLAHTVGDKASDLAHTVGDKASDLGSQAKSLVDIIRLNPIPAALTGLSLGWLIMSSQNKSTNGTMYRSDRFDTTTGEFGQNNFGTSSTGLTGSQPSGIDAAKEKIGDVKDTVTSRASDLASNVSEKATGLASTVSDKASSLASTVSDKASNLGSTAKDTAQTAVSATGSFINGNPLAAGAIALMLGVGTGLLIPATQKENELLGETRDRLKDQASEQLHQVADKVTNVAQTAFDGVKQTVKDEAQNQGLTGSTSS